LQRVRHSFVRLLKLSVSVTLRNAWSPMYVSAVRLLKSGVPVTLRVQHDSFGCSHINRTVVWIVSAELPPFLAHSSNAFTSIPSFFQHVCLAFTSACDPFRYPTASNPCCFPMLMQSSNDMPLSNPLLPSFLKFWIFPLANHPGTRIVSVSALTAVDCPCDILQLLYKLFWCV
jgi:hypothetical protein